MCAGCCPLIATRNNPATGTILRFPCGVSPPTSVTRLSDLSTTSRVATPSAESKIAPAMTMPTDLGVLSAHSRGNH
ncbi:hypothetical protein BDV12DRAFT_42515 [Aspergillus spectabilis]